MATKQDSAPAANSFKRCAQCKHTRPLTDFHRNTRNSDGRQPRCKPCLREYAKQYRHPHPRPAPPERKRCSVCKEVKPVSEFQPRSQKTPKLRRHGTVHAYCKLCMSAWRKERYHSDPIAARARTRAYALAHPEKIKAYRKTQAFKGAWFRNWLRRKYDISVDDFDAMVIAQSGRCAICSKAFRDARDAHVDHDHTTGKVRAILCNRCNVGVGMFLDDPDTALSAHHYLKFHARKARLA